MQPPNHFLQSSMSAALETLRRIFGYSSFRGLQAEIIQHINLGGDALVLMPTGGGKSLCYQIPALLRPGIGIIVSPLIALMQNQVEALRQLGVRAAYLNSALDHVAAAEVEKQLLRSELDLLYIAPERLLTERFIGRLDHLNKNNQIALFAIDEAHCVSQWGHDFRPEYMQLSTLHQRYPQVPRIALTATADSLTRQEIVSRLGLESAQVFISSFDRPNIRYRVVERGSGVTGSRWQLLDFIDSHRGKAGIVYCLSRRKVDDIASWLCAQGIDALPYHAGLESSVRERHQRRFLREEGVVMVATIAFGMGIDKPDVRFVAHLDLPRSLEAYYQETGRAGRDGETAEAWMTYGLNDVVIHRQRIDESQAGEEQKRIERNKLDALLAWCETATCRRVALLRYFGEESAPCDNCDICIEPPAIWDGTEAARKAMSAILRTGQRFGAGHLIDILRGKTTEKIHQFSHQTLPTFGVGAELDEPSWRSVFRQLLAQGLLQVNAHAYGALQLNEIARPVLKGEQSVFFRRSLAVAKKSALARRRNPRPLSPPSPSAHSDDALLDTLRGWRTALAREQGVPAYVILHDRTLQEIAARKPASTAELLDIPGIGEAKATRYGKPLLELLLHNFSAID
jgi:ATP-dependent DNA helicase RecQ